MTTKKNNKNINVPIHKNKTIKLGNKPVKSSEKVIFKKKMKKYSELDRLRCSPKEHKNGFSCLEDDTIYKLRDLWNARHPDSIIDTNNSHEIWIKLKHNLSDVCNKESCWLKQKFVKGKLNKELKTSFAPLVPQDWKKDPDEWLSSMDILNVMKQYEQAYKCFEFIGPTPIDFDKKKMHGECVWDEMCNFSVANQIKNKKFKIGIIFNTDPHDKPGAHWHSMFINIKKGTIFFFDSAGSKAPKRIMTFVNRIIKQGASLDSKIVFKFDQNYPVEHQYGYSTCGIYALYFIVHLLEDKHTEEYFKTHIITDEYVNQFRSIYFNKSL